MTNRSREQMHCSFPFGCNAGLVSQRPCLGVESLAHKGDPDQIIGVTSPNGICRPTRGDLHFLKRLEDRNVVVASNKKRPNLVGKLWLQ